MYIDDILNSCYNNDEIKHSERTVEMANTVIKYNDKSINSAFLDYYVIPELQYEKGSGENF